MAVLRLAVLAYLLTILAVTVLSWFPMEPGGPGDRLFRALRSVTDPVLLPVRRVLPPVGGVVDLSPMVVVFALSILYQALS
jgi:uncharacterized protein YggT (Ycf19 family)